MTVVLFIYIEYWIGRVFFLPYFKYIMPQPSVFHVSDEKWDVNLIKDLCAWCFVSCFFLAIFKTLSLSFDSLIIMCLGVYPVCVCSSLSHVQLFERPWTVAYKAPLPMEFSRQEYWSGLPCPPPGDLPNPGIEPRSPVLQTDSLPSDHQGSPVFILSEFSVELCGVQCAFWTYRLMFF